MPHPRVYHLDSVEWLDSRHSSTIYIHLPVGLKHLQHLLRLPGDVEAVNVFVQNHSIILLQGISCPCTAILGQLLSHFEETS